MSFKGYDITESDLNTLIFEGILIEEPIEKTHIPILIYISDNTKYITHILKELGTQLGKMTKMNFNHGDLVPEHIFYNVQTNTVCFITPEFPIAYDFDIKLISIESIFNEAFIDLSDTFKKNRDEIYEGFKIGYNLNVIELKKKLH